MSDVNALVDSVDAARVLDRGMERSKSLHKDFPFDIPASGAAGHLRQELKRPLAGAEVRLVQREVGVNYSNQGDIREMKPFGDHLSAH